MDILSNLHQKQLVEQARLKSLYTNEYLNDTKNENLSLIAELFFDNNKARAKQFNVWSNLFSTITDNITNFVGRPVTEIDINVSEQVKDLVSVGKWVFGLRRVGSELETYYIEAKDHIIIDWVHTVFKLYEVKENIKVDYYVLKQSFYDTYIENQLFKVNEVTSTSGNIVPLDTIPQTSGLTDIMETGIKSIFVTYKTSILEKIKPLVYSIDRKLVMFETQFLGEIEQFKIFQNIAIPEVWVDENWRVDFKKIWKIFANDVTRDGVSDIKIISNQNQLIAEAIEYEKTQLRKVSSATTIPTDFLGIEDWGAISGTSREILIQSFIKNIENYRNSLEKVINEILAVVASEKQIETGVIWNEIISKGDKELAEELKIARDAGIISQFTGVKLYLGLDDEQTQKELDRLQSTQGIIVNNNNTQWGV